MPYRILPGEPPTEGVRRMVREQIVKMIGEIDDEELDRNTVVHQVRKRVKKVRAAIRLLQPSCYALAKEENAYFRDASRELSHLRDAQVLVRTFEKLKEEFREQLENEAGAAIGDFLQRRRSEATDDAAAFQRHLSTFRAKMVEAHTRVGEWALPAGGDEIVAAGFVAIYHRGRKAMRHAYEHPSSEAFHDWRKRVKDHWYHWRIFQPLWPRVVDGVRHEARHLGDILGDDHDLAVFAAVIAESPLEIRERGEVLALLPQVERCRAAIITEAKRLGMLLFAEKRSAFATRLKAYFAAWREGEVLATSHSEAAAGWPATPAS